MGGVVVVAVALDDGNDVRGLALRVVPLVQFLPLFGVVDGDANMTGMSLKSSV
jgi:hypothetical protein